MPNHVYQKLLFKNPAIYDFVKTKDSCFSEANFFPMPKELEGTISPSRETTDKKELAHREHLRNTYGAENWYDWCNKNWGTKWGIYEPEIIDGGFSFQSAWSPITKIVLKLSEHFPDEVFTLTFADEGGGFIGWEDIKNGQITVTQELDWDSPEGKECREDLGMWYDDDDDEELDGVEFEGDESDLETQGA